jgi:hypothetical protein
MQGLELEVTNCTYCGATHRLSLDASGHFSGPLPCDTSKRIELQVEPERWRQMVEAEVAKTKH